MNAFSAVTGGAGSRRWSRGIALVAMAWGFSALAQVVAVPAAHLNHAEGTVALSPQGDTEWHDVQPRRVLKRGDRLWIDRGSRAELQAGGHALRLDGQTQLVLENVSETATQLSLTQGSMVITVTRVNPGDSVEIGTPNLAFRARQPGDYRIDVDPKGGTTRVVVLAGDGVVYGEKGEALELRTGQRAAFKERALARVAQGAFAANDDFDRWSTARRRGEPTVSMPAVAQATPPPAPHTALVNKGRDIIIAGPASSLPGSKLAQATSTPGPLAQAKMPPAQMAAQVAAQQAKAAVAAPAAPLPAAASMVPHAQVIPTVPVAPAVPSAIPLRVTAPATAAEGQAQVQARAAAQAAAAREQERQRVAQQRQDDERRAAKLRAEEDRKLGARMRAEEQRRALAAAKRAEEERRLAHAKKADESRRVAHAKHEHEQKKLAARKAEEKRQAAARAAAEAQKVAEARKRHLAHLQEQAGREEQSARDQQARREALARKAEEDRKEEQARREEADRRQRQLADQWKRDQDKRDQEVWLRQQQQGVPAQPIRPTPMGVPFRRVS